MKMERDLLKNSRRILRRSRGEVPGHGRIAIPVSAAADVSAAWRIGQRVLHLAPSWTVAARRKSHAWKRKSATPTGARERRTGRSSCRRIWPNMACRSVCIAFAGCARSWDCAVCRNAGPRRQPIRSTIRRSRQTCSSSGSLPRSRTRCGQATGRTSRLTKAGCTWSGLRNCIPTNANLPN